MPRDGSSILGYVWPFMWHALHGSSFNTTKQNICPYDPHVDECAPAYMYPHCTGNFSTKNSFWGSLSQTTLKMSCGCIFKKGIPPHNHKIRTCTSLSLPSLSLPFMIAFMVNGQACWAPPQDSAT